MIPPTRRQFLRDASCAGVFIALGDQRPPFAGASAGDERNVDGIRLCWCPPGRFVMGADQSTVSVTLTKGFFAGKFEVTQAQWRRLMGAFPDRQPSDRFGLGDDMPAYWVSFDDAERCAAEATRAARASGALPAPWKFSLPTEAQWEYACRAGTTTAWAFGDRLEPDQANFSVIPPSRAADAVGSSKRVGSYQANRWGLHDMHGNVWEWCRDWYHLMLPGGTDPDLSGVRGMRNRDGTYSRVRRGGAWIESAESCRSGSRLPYEPNRSSDHIGFRLFVVEG